MNGSDRRYLCLTVSTKYKGKSEYFAALGDAIQNGGLTALMHELRQYDPADAGLEWSDVFTAPLTDERKAMRLQSLRPAQRVIMQMVEDGELIAPDESSKGTIRYTLSNEGDTPIEKGAIRRAIAKVSHSSDNRSDVGDILEELFGKLVTTSKKTAKYERVTVYSDGSENVESLSKKGANVFLFPPLSKLQERMKDLFNVDAA